MVFTTSFLSLYIRSLTFTSIFCMALNGLVCADVRLRTHTLTQWVTEIKQSRCHAVRQLRTAVVSRAVLKNVLHLPTCSTEISTTVVCYHPRMWSCVRSPLSLCLRVCPILALKSLDLDTLFLVCVYAFPMSRLCACIKVTRSRSRSRSQEQKARASATKYTYRQWSAFSWKTISFWNCCRECLDCQHLWPFSCTLIKANTYFSWQRAEAWVNYDVIAMVSKAVFVTVHWKTQTLWLETNLISQPWHFLWKRRQIPRAAWKCRQIWWRLESGMLLLTRCQHCLLTLECGVYSNIVFV